ncbi:protein of unknown function [Nitrospira japonica]|uniref:Uncharacterized protein n=1 Tax=Nitrospira japonica TaxID=1325564 RepID=A0A1W1I7M5_9BACT|nr:protein of unknown function [Nitrospira japonica]
MIRLVHRPELLGFRIRELHVARDQQLLVRLELLLQDLHIRVRLCVRRKHRNGHQHGSSQHHRHHFVHEGILSEMGVMERWAGTNSTLISVRHRAGITLNEALIYHTLITLTKWQKLSKLTGGPRGESSTSQYLNHKTQALAPNSHGQTRNSKSEIRNSKPQEMRLWDFWFRISCFEFSCRSL